MEKKKVISILVIMFLIICIPYHSLAADFDLSVKFDGRSNITMESETEDMNWDLNCLLPGQKDTSSLNVHNDGKAPVKLQMSISIEEDDGLLEMIDLKVTNKAGDEVYNGSYKDLKTIEVPLAAGATETYTVETSMNVHAGNEYQNKQYKLKFNFIATGTELVGKLTIRYVDQYGKDIEPPTIESKFTTETYNYTNVTPKSFEELGYSYTGKVDGKLSGNYELNGSEIVYHYAKYSNVTVKHVVDNEFENDGTNKVLKQATDRKVVGEEYSYSPESFPGYQYANKVDGKPSDQVSEEPKEVIFHYNKVEEKDNGRVIVLYVDENGNELERKVDTNIVGEDYSYTEGEIIKNIPGYKYIGYTGDLVGQYKKEDTIIYCHYESIKYGNLIVLCIDENNNVIKRTVTTREVGTDYDLGEVGEEIPGYEFLGVDGETSGKYVLGDIVVTYKYKSIKKGPSTNVVTKPKTGDTVIKYVGLAIGAVIILAVVIIIMKKKNKDD